MSPKTGHVLQEGEGTTGRRLKWVAETLPRGPLRRGNKDCKCSIIVGVFVPRMNIGLGGVLELRIPVGEEGGIKNKVPSDEFQRMYTVSSDRYRGSSGRLILETHPTTRIHTHVRIISVSES